MGAFVYLFVNGGLLAITKSTGELRSPSMIYIIAGLAGFQHNVFTDLVKRVMKVLQLESTQTLEHTKQRQDEHDQPELPSNKIQE